MHVLRSKRVLVLLSALIVAGVLAAVALSAVISRQVYAEGNTLKYRFERVVTARPGSTPDGTSTPGS